MVSVTKALFHLNNSNNFTCIDNSECVYIKIANAKLFVPQLGKRLLKMIDFYQNNNTMFENRTIQL